jgi:DNA-binding NarL/FixJ family response regulator
MTRPRVLMADDHRMVAEGLRGVLEPAYELVDIVADGRQLVEAAQHLQPDVIVADITMPQLNGLDAIVQLRRGGCAAKIVFLTMHCDTLYAVRAMRAGASAYVLKQSAATELLDAIGEALAGRTYVAPALADNVQRMLAAEPEDASSEVLLTPRQREVLQLFAEGHSAKQVARLLHISVRTAENHKARIMQLLGATSTADLVQCAIRHGLIAPA